MGAVWKAVDTTLGREVAIKVLPEHVAADPDRAARFEREAKVLASLNHPNVAAIYGFHESQGLRFLAMELVPGEDLAQRIARGPVPSDDARKIASKIAEALEYAHERGIVHRDLKPANVKLTPDGEVKVLDFGLAKAMTGDPTSSGATSTPTILPTVTSAGTAVGMILGTAAYMSPEQARGKIVDKRADIWAFGVVAVEMLTGKRLFDGETVSDTIAGVLTRPIEIDGLPFASLWKRCLERDPKLRLRDIGEARIALGSPESLAVPSARRRPPSLAIAGAAVVFLLAGAAIGKLLFSRDVAPPRTVRLTLQAPEGTTLDSTPAISPDGAWIAFAARDDASKLRIYLRATGSAEARALSGSEGGYFPFWSPDSTSIGFCDGTSIKTLGIESGIVRTIGACADSFRGGAWTKGTIVYAPTSNSALEAVPAEGGEARAVTTLDPSVPDLSHRFPVFLPDGKRFLYLGWSNAADAREDALGIFLGDVDGSPPKRVSGERSSVGIVGTGPSAHLLFARKGSLLAVPFDADRVEIGGGEQVVETTVGSSESSGYANFSATSAGDVASLPRSGTSGFKPNWTDRSGSDLPDSTFPIAANYQNMRIAPDGRRVVAEILEPGGWSDLWILDTDRGVSTRLTTEPFSHSAPVWHPDGKTIGFSAEPTGSMRPYAISADGSGRAAELPVPPGYTYLAGWSPDGAWLLLSRIDDHITSWAREIANGREAAICRGATPCEEPAVSPDGRWVAFTSDVSGRPEIYVHAFPDAGAQWQISNEGGHGAHWRSDGREIVYRDPEGWVVAVGVEPGSSFEFGKPKRLFRMQTRSLVAPSPDHERFLGADRDLGAGITANVILGWR